MFCFKIKESIVLPIIDGVIYPLGKVSGDPAGRCMRLLRVNLLKKCILLLNFRLKRYLCGNYFPYDTN